MIGSNWIADKRITHATGFSPSRLDCLYLERRAIIVQSIQQVQHYQLIQRPVEIALAPASWGYTRELDQTKLQKCPFSYYLNERLCAVHCPPSILPGGDQPDQY
jgi:hypothetical protein